MLYQNVILYNYLESNIIEGSRRRRKNETAQEKLKNQK